MESLYEAIKNSNWEVIDNFLEAGGDINSSLVSSGSKAGFTILHFAVIRKNMKYVKNLITNYQADVNAMSKNGAQPIHLACLARGRYKITDALLEAGANPDAELTEKVFGKYAKYGEWYDEFGDKMTLLTFVVVNGDGWLSKILLDHNANFKIKSADNKTLLMYALENGHAAIAELLVSKMKDYPELIDARDDDSYHAVHYFLPIERYEEFRYKFNPSLQNELNDVLMAMILAGADINATVNGDPDTLLINMAAYRANQCLVERLLNDEVPLDPKSRALHYATLPVDPKKFMEHDESMVRGEIEEQKKDTIRSILENMCFRREFGLFVPEEEKNLMDQLIAKDEKIQKIVCKYYHKVIDGVLKVKFVQIEDQPLTIYDFMIKVFDDRELKLLTKNSKFVKACKKFWKQRNSPFESVQISMFRKIMKEKVIKIIELRKLLQKVEKIKDLREAIPLPYELILKIIEYLDNKSLANFIDSFYEVPISPK